MKANAPENMYIPEKIYLPYKDGKVIGLVKETGVPFKSGVDGNIEYTRTDAFIEKVCEWLKENANKYLYNTGENGEYIPTCSGRMIDEFRKHMGGE